MIREYNEHNEDYVKMFCNAKFPYNKLSNFNWIKDGIIGDDGLTYASTEHLFQSYKYIQEDRHRFSTNGDLGNISGLALVFKTSEYEKKQKYWMKKNNIGIIAKMATNKKIGIKLGLRRDNTFETNDKLWISILNKKYEIDEYKSLLQNTNDLFILEFDRHASAYFHKTGNTSYWSGIIQNNILYGNNQMGKYLMHIRELYELNK